ncbi:MAG: hypothetical protein Q7K16_04140 [Candidatus Azambacteria bacterium]|nr:hypothetical protein [Candidatus Azambacteria bacterium]
MRINDLIQLLNNRLREFQLSRDYARMSGDLERMNVADKEILTLEDTLFQLNLLVDTSKSAAVREAILAEVITDGSIAILGEYDITSYATDPLHEEKIMNILSKMGVMDTVEKIDDYIENKNFSSPITGEMIMSAVLAYTVDARLMMAIMEQDSRFGTVGVAVRTLNPGNVGNDDDGNTRTYESWQEGVTAVAEWLSRHRGSTIIPEETVLEPTATSTPSIIIPTATSTPITATSTTTTFITIPTTATSTPTTATTTPITTTSTTTTATTTPVIDTSTPTTATTTPVTVTSEETAATSTPPIITSTTTTATTTPVTATSTPETITPAATSTPSTIPDTSTSTPPTATSTPTTAD